MTIPRILYNIFICQCRNIAIATKRARVARQWAFEIGVRSTCLIKRTRRTQTGRGNSGVKHETLIISRYGEKLYSTENINHSVCAAQQRGHLLLPYFIIREPAINVAARSFKTEARSSNVLKYSPLFQPRHGNTRSSIACRGVTVA